MTRKNSDEQTKDEQKKTAVQTEELGDADDIVVTGTRTPQRRGDSPVASEVITREDIERSGLTDVGQVMMTMGGVQVDRGFAGAGVSIQGLEAKHTLILIDGDRVTGAKDGVVDLERFNTEQIERIEIVRGAGSALYGADAIGGVINIVTRKNPKEFTASATSLFGDDKSQSYTGRVGGDYKRLQTQLIGGLHLAPSFDLTPEDDSPQTHGSEIRDWYVRSKSKLMLAKRSKAHFTAEYSNRERAGIDASGSGATYDRRQLVDQYDAQLKFEHKTERGDRYVASIRGNHIRDQFLKDQRRSDKNDSYEDSKLWLIQGNAQTDQRLPKQNVLSIGADGIGEGADNPRIVNGSGCDPDVPQPECQTAHRLRGAIYIQDVFTPLLDPYLVFVLGGRLELDSDFGYQAVPRFAVRVDPTQELAIRASVGKGYRAPTFKELYLRFDNPSVGYTVRGNTDLEPETSLSYQMSVDWTIIPFLRFHVGGFYNEIDGLIDFQFVEQPGAVGVLDRYQLTNFASAYTIGSQSEITLGPTPYGELRLSYQILEARDEEKKRALPGRARHQGSVTLILTAPSLGLSLTTNAVSTGQRPFFIPNDDGPDTEVMGEAYTNLMVTVSWSFRQWLRTFVRCENLLNEGNSDFLTQRPRRFVFGLIVRN